MRVIAAALLIAAGLAACQKAGSASASLPDLTLSTAAGSRAALKSCPTAKCVTAYVAPWCPHCRASTPGILALRDDLAKKGVTLRVVVGMDAPENLREYASAFGPDTLLDPNGRFAVKGVPHFLVTDSQGHIAGDYAGVPHDGASGQELADAFGLP